MSGKAYTMKEMKAIVDYLTEKRAYSEIRGRKMWVEFEKSKFTDRTWQSLKETFLKRILPDIHNPYYQLSITQISSFRQGCDVETKLKNKLEIRSPSAESNNNAKKPLSTEEPSTSSNKEDEKISGEETINSKTVSHHRSSADTIILDPCYETAEDIQRDLESPKQGNQNEKEKDTDKSPTKSLRDFITYSEPLTPMLQEVIEDFATDEEREGSDTETQMEVADDLVTDKNLKGTNGHKSDVPVDISSETDDVSNNADVVNESQDIGKNQLGKGTNKREKKSNETAQSTENKIETPSEEVIEVEDAGNSENEKSNKEHTSEQTGSLVPDTNKDCKTAPPNNETENIADNMLQDIEKDVIENDKKKDTTSQPTGTQNDSNTTVDTLLPNNQEELNIESDAAISDSRSKTTIKEVQTKKLTLNKNSEKSSRKRAISQEPTISKHKRLYLIEKSKPMSVSDTDAAIRQNGNLKEDLKSVLSNNRKQKEKILQISDNENEDDTVEHKKVELEKVTEENVVVDSNDIIKNKGEDEQKLLNKFDMANSDLQNPCLKSVSLYDEQFTPMKYSESSDDVIAPNTQGVTLKTKVHKENSSDGNEIVLLKSHSESEKNEVKKKKNIPVPHIMPRSEREKALANVFGFSSGGVASSRKRRVSYQNRSNRRQSHTKISSGSSEWTSESDTEFISPPRGRRNRPTRKYLKPKSARILSLEEEGGLFVMYGKKIYPVVKDGKIVKNYVTYAPDRDSEDEEESFWKLKYIEERKRSAKLSKLLTQNIDEERPSSERVVPFNQNKPSASKEQKLLKNQPETTEKTPGQEILSKEHDDIQKAASDSDKMLKIKITKQNEEVQLEGHWSQIHPVLDHVVQIFHKEIEPRADVRSTLQSEQRKYSSSGISTPVFPVLVDQEVREKVNKLETEIFKEIEARDKHENQSDEPQPTQESKITKRRPGRPKKSISSNVSDAKTPEKKPKISVESPKIHIEENVEKLAPVETENGTTATVTRKTRTPKKVLHESTERNENNVIKTRTKKTTDVQPTTEEIVDEETDVRYKFPSPPPSAKKTYRKSGANKTSKDQKPKNRYAKKMIGIFSSPDNVSVNSIESSQGYQDSDISPYINICFRKKKKFSIPSLYSRGKYHTRQSIRRRTQLKPDEIPDQSSNSCPDFPFQSRTFQNSSLNTEIYRSDSYQLLMPKVRNSFKQLAKIDEVNLDDKMGTEIATRDCYMSQSQFHHNEVNSIATNEYTNYFDLGGENTDINNSSNVSLPPSPVLSIVENISINKNAFSSVDEDMLENEVENKDEMEEYNRKKDFKITDVDVSMPLMGQDCGLQTSSQNLTELKYDPNNLNMSAVITDSFLNKVCTVNIADNPSLSDTINQKLRNLLLESAQKLARTSQVDDDGDSNKMDVDINQAKATNKTRLKKRCSTPHKRQGTRKSKKRKPEIDTFVEEERIESCSQGGRRSCPPFITLSDAIEHNNQSENENAVTKSKNLKARKKKDNIIKVKILRPRYKIGAKGDNMEQTAKNACDKSLHADSGINNSESGVFLQGFNDSVDLIHNHSDTCLQANECVGDSIEFIENNTKSVISLETNSEHSIDMESQDQLNNEKGISCELFTNYASDATSFRKVIETTRPKETESNEGTTYHTPMNSENSPLSIMTEDLSNDVPIQSSSRPSKWYFFSEDETTNTNFAIQKHSNGDVSYGSNLNNLFPVTCAVPDLSTITEMSKENDNKPTDTDGDTRNDFLSQSIFDCNFDSNI